GVAPVVQHHAVPARGELAREGNELVMAAPAAGGQHDPRPAIANLLPVDVHSADVCNGHVPPRFVWLVTSTSQASACPSGMHTRSEARQHAFSDVEDSATASHGVLSVPRADAGGGNAKGAAVHGGARWVACSVAVRRAGRRRRTS